MSEGKYDRNIELTCPTCGGSQFEHGDDLEADYAQVRCIGCDRVLTQDELLAANAENVDEHIKEIGDEVVKDLQKKLNQMFKRTWGR